MENTSLGLSMTIEIMGHLTNFMHCDIKQSHGFGKILMQWIYRYLWCDWYSRVALYGCDNFLACRHSIWYLRQAMWFTVTYLEI